MKKTTRPQHSTRDQELCSVVVEAAIRLVLRRRAIRAPLVTAALLRVDEAEADLDRATLALIEHRR